ncbi:heat shock protein 70 family member [Tieghemostelium lacteum]|uniref:Heat shock protein 70 family member n=1 Tax=Tieghemostelium lacteum TaxID=361077 RepID=A0A152A3V3_TIELA|nr:heat shock protein 70 family member [Tieghemostelium lacteum]|eukprot:KYR00890.1 heat shock protein 70 family member [Tieghemostelium lacteum]
MTKLTILLLLIVTVQFINCNVIGIDFGSQTFKIGLIKPGAFETVLNEQSGRKTVNSVGWYQNERVFTSDAFNLWVRNPKQVYQLTEYLLGKEYQEGYLETVGYGSLGYTVTNDVERNTFSVDYDTTEGIKYSPEELTGMIFKKIRDLASVYSGSSIKDCVIAVPPFFNQQQRQAILDAAQLGGLNVMSLVNNINAAAINYAMDRTFLDKNQTVIFYDMGYKSTKLSLVTFNSFNEVIKSTKKNKTATNVIVKNTEWDEHLGGLNFDMVIVNYLKELITKQKPAIDVNDVKLTIKLLKEASKMKETLSVNQQAHIFIGSLYEDWDFTASLTKQQFEELSKELLERSVEPLKRLIKDSGLNTQDIDLIELIGGSTRIPAFQQTLKQFMKRDVLDKHLNGDESISSGSSFFAASLTSYFKVKDIRLKDITAESFNIKLASSEPVETTDHHEDPEDTLVGATGEHASDNQLLLFKKHNRLGFKKTMRFYTNENITLDLSSGGKILSSYHLTGLPVPSEKLNFTGKPKVVCHFKLTSSGMVLLEKAEAEILVSAVRIKSNYYLSPTYYYQLIKRMINQFFNFIDTLKDNTKSILEFKPKATETPKPVEEEPTGSQEAAEDKPVEIEVEPEQFIETEVYTKQTSIPLDIQIVHHTVKPLSKEAMKISKSRLDNLDKIDENLKNLRKEKNSLESFIYETRDKLDSEEIIQHSIQEERDQLYEDLSKASNWLEEAEYDTKLKAEDYKSQLTDIKKKSSKIFNRVEQRALIPVGLEELSHLIAKLRLTMPNMTKDLNITEEDLEDAQERFETISKWVETKKQDFQVAELTKDLPFTSTDIRIKLMEMERLVKDLSSKRKKKVTPPPKSTTKPKKSTETDQPEEESPKDTTPEQQQESEPQQQETSDTESQKPHDEL